MHQLDTRYYMTERGKKIREAFRAKYGVDHPSQLPSVKEKIRQKRESGSYDNVVKKMQSTKLKKYGDPNFGNVDKGRKTKEELYGDANYNNREKMLKTNLERYGTKVAPTVVESTKRRSCNGEIGFNSDSYKKFLLSNGVTNVSQLEYVRRKKSNKAVQTAYESIVSGNRLNGEVTPLFSEQTYMGSDYQYSYPFQCNKCGNKFSDHLYSGHIPRCLNCYPHHKFESVGQCEMVQFIINLGIVPSIDNRQILNGKEIDIYIDDRQFGIEFNGVYWHSEISGNKDKKYHVGKTEECLKRGVKLLHVLDQEWKEKRPIIESILRSQFNVGITTIFARKCVIKSVNNTECQSFLSENHIQGNDKSSIRLGLYHENDLVSVMTFCRSRYDKSVEYEMSRFCTKLNYRVLGGASKLFSHFIKTLDPKSIVSYSDRRFFSGKTYTMLGMKKVKDTPPSYFYTKNGSIVGTRLTFQKHKLSKILSTFDNTKSEWENMKANGFDRIWDCGHAKYIWEK